MVRRKCYGPAKIRARLPLPGRHVSLAADLSDPAQARRRAAQHPECDRFLAAMVLTIPARPMAYHRRVARSIDPELSRNLSKTSTVD